MRSTLILLLVLFQTAFTYAQKGSGNYIPISDAYINDDFTIKLTNGRKEIKNRQTFSLRDYGLDYANLGAGDKPFYISADCQNLIDAYQDFRVHTYDISIENPETHAKFYGKIGFFVAKSQASSKAVTRVYNINVTPDEFARGTNGRTSVVYELYDIDGKRYPTWVIWLSDLPLSRNGGSEILKPVGGDVNRKKLASGIASTVIGGLFVAGGAPLVAFGVPMMFDEEFPEPGIIMTAVGSAMLVAAIPLIITGPIKIAKSVKGKYGRGMELCFKPNYDPITARGSLGMKLQF